MHFFIVYRYTKKEIPRRKLRRDDKENVERGAWSEER